MAQISELGIAVLVNLGFLTLAAGALCLRIWARRIMKLTLRLNDYAAITAWVGGFLEERSSGSINLTDASIGHSGWLGRNCYFR